MELTEAQTTELTGAEIVSRCLAEEGIEFVFGYPGGAVLPIYDELFKHPSLEPLHTLDHTAVIPTGNFLFDAL